MANTPWTDGPTDKEAVGGWGFLGGEKVRVGFGFDSAIEFDFYSDFDMDFAFGF